MRHAVVLGVASLSFFSLGADPGGCGESSSSSGLNAPCTRDYDCASGLVCSGGVCESPDGGGAEGDAGGSTKDAAGGD